MTTKTIIPLLGSLLLCAPHANAALALLNTNLIENGDAQTDTGKTTWGKGTVTGWNDQGATHGDTTVTSSNTEIGYSINTQAYAGAYSQAASQTYSGSKLTTYYGNVTSGDQLKGTGNLLGTNYLYAGGNGKYSMTQSQTISLAGNSSLITFINSGNAGYTSEGWFGGYGPGSSQGDYGQLNISFFSSIDGTGTAISSTMVGQTAGNTDKNMHFYSESGFVPVGTQSIIFVANYVKTYGDNDAAMDNLAFVIVPEPSSSLLLLGSCALLAFKRRR